MTSNVEYPQNLIESIGLDKVCQAEVYIPLSEEQTAGLEFALSTLKPRETDMLLLHFEMKKTYAEIGEYYGRSTTCVYQVITKGIRKLRHPSRLRYFCRITKDE